MKALILIALTLSLSPAIASAEPKHCDLEQASNDSNGNPRYGVRYRSASGWIYAGYYKSPQLACQAQNRMYSSGFCASPCSSR